MQTLLKHEPDVTVSPDCVCNNDILRVAFVCTGNTCRSPMAAAAANHLCKGRVYAVSCGINAYDGMPISYYAVEALENAGILSVEGNNYKNHVSRGVTAGIISGCDRVYGMTARHTISLIASFPELAPKISTMPRDIPDPFGGSLYDYERCLEKIIGCIKELFVIE